MTLGKYGCFERFYDNTTTDNTGDDIYRVTVYGVKPYARVHTIADRNMTDCWLPVQHCCQRVLTAKITGLYAILLYSMIN